MPVSHTALHVRDACHPVTLLRLRPCTSMGALRDTSVHPSSPLQTPLRMCPASCINLGSFGAAFAAKSSCVCGGAEQVAALAGAASDTWKVRRAPRHRPPQPGCVCLQHANAARPAHLAAGGPARAVTRPLQQLPAARATPTPCAAPASPNPLAQHLVHALAALALMGLADLWLIMNLSATFAHAKRDMRDVSRA